MGIKPEWTISNYSDFAIVFLLGFGIAFEIPIAILLLVKFKILSPKFLIEKRKHAIIIIFIISAILTPPDVISQLLMGIPLVGLYELSILLARFISRKK